MISNRKNRINNTLSHLLNDAKNDRFKIFKGAAKSIFRPIVPLDFRDAYLSISEEQGKDLVHLIEDNHIRSIVEFGTSFGISTLYMAQGVLSTGGHIITTELLESKANVAKENFGKAGVTELIELRVGDAMETLKDFSNPIDLLVLDGWKDLYLPLFKLLEPNFHTDSITYVDNADMPESQKFLKVVAQTAKYQLQSVYGGKAVIITNK